MVIRVGIKKKLKIESIIMSHPVQVINWTSESCMPCKNQERTLREINQELDSIDVGITNIEFHDHKKDFSKLGNKLLPSLNVFVHGAQMKFIDTKLKADGQKGIKNKPIKALAGSRSKSTLIGVIHDSLERIT
jgi:glutaredoxin